jgi:hypothetical protein
MRYDAKEKEAGKVKGLAVATYAPTNPADDIDISRHILRRNTCEPALM